MNVVDPFLFQHGKDFDAIHNLLAFRSRKRGIEAALIKTKEQVRYLYYRMWQKISTHVHMGNSKGLLLPQGLLLLSVWSQNTDITMSLDKCQIWRQSDSGISNLIHTCKCVCMHTHTHAT